MKQIKVIVEKHTDGYVAYPLGDVKSAIQFHVETFGSDVLDTDTPVLEAFVAETGVAL
jgi:hypothetical protein